MVAGRPELEEYAQIGYLRRGGWTHTHGFSEFDAGRTACPAPCTESHYYNFTRYIGSYDWFASGSTSSYVVKTMGDNSAGLGMYVDGDLKQMAMWDPHLVWATEDQLWHAQFFAETFDRGDDIPGTPTAKADARNIQVAKCSACGYADAEVVLDNDYPIAYNVMPGAQVGCGLNCVDVWSDRTGSN